MRYWRFLYTGEQDCYANMALDEAVLLSVESGKAPPTVRVYRWNAPSISIGYKQRVSLQDNLSVPLVRRPTGGRAVFHDDEYTISVAARYEDFEGSSGLLDTYSLISSAILMALRSFGVDAELVPRKTAVKNSKTPICFEIASVYELTCSGEKIVGSAQRRLKNGFLQQSSIPFDIDMSRFPPTQEIFKNTYASSSKNVKFLKNFIKRIPDETEVVHSFRNSFEQALNIKFEENKLCADEVNAAHTLREKKYSQKHWNHLRQHVELDMS